MTSYRLDNNQAAQALGISSAAGPCDPPMDNGNCRERRLSQPVIEGERSGNRNPETIGNDGLLTVRKMSLGEPDASGRRRPVATDATISMQADTIISAIGEQVDEAMLKELGIPIDSTTNGFCDNQSVMKNTMIPKSTLSKKHNAIAYHKV